MGLTFPDNVSINSVPGQSVLSFRGFGFGELFDAEYLPSLAESFVIISSPVKSVYNVEMVLPVKVFPAVNWLRVL